MDPDKELLKRLGRKDEDAYRELLERLEKPLINFIYSFVGKKAIAEDIFQETFIRVVKMVRKFRPKATLSTWIFTIARNLCLDHIKYEKRHKMLPLEGVGEEGKIIYFEELIRSKIIDPAEKLLKKEKEDFLRKVLLKIAPRLREALILRIYLELPYSEITKILGVPVGTAKYRVHEGLKILAELLSEGERGYEKKEEIL